MFSLILRRSIPILSNRTIVSLRTYSPRSNALVRPFSISSIHRNFPNMKEMMDEMAKNPKAMALFKAIQKDPKILQSIQELMTILNRKGYIDMKNPTKPPSLAMLADSEIRTKLFELMKLLSAAGIFNAKDGANLSSSLSNVMGLLMPSTDKTTKSKSLSSQKYDFTYDATTKETDLNDKNKNSETGWSEKLKKLFK